MPRHNFTCYRITKFKHPPLDVRRPPQHRFRIRYCVLAIICALSPYYCPSSTFAVSESTCADVEFIFARGSGESLGSDTYRAWEDSLISELDEELGAQSLSYHFHELEYPAVRVAGDLKGIINLGGAAISGGEAYAFGESVSAGVIELKTYMDQKAITCPRTKFVLGGYSQGAMVITRSLPSLNANQIIYAATFGDPKLYLPEGSHPQSDEFYVPEACYGLNLSEYREYVPDCYAYAGILGAAIPYQPLGYSGKLGTWCNQDDIICSSGSSIEDHISYVSDRLYLDAARRIVRAIKSAFADRLDYGFATNQHIHEVAIVADITGSMARGDLYWRLTSEAKKLAAKVIAAGGRVSYFTYRDLIEGTETKKLCDFTCTLDEFGTAIDSVKLIAGEDDNESAISAMDYAINALNWSENSEKSLLILTDGGLHDPDRDGKTSADVIASSKLHGGVKIFAPVWKEYIDEYRTVAEQTGGQVLNLGSGIKKATSAILPSPIINLAQTSYEGPVKSHFVFDASGSQVFVGPDLVYDWDLDGNGLYELQNAGPVVEKTFDRFEGEVFVRATDRAGHSTVSSAYVKAQGLLTPQPVTKITGANLKIDTKAAKSGIATRTNASKNFTAQVSFSTDANRILLIVDELILGFIESNSGQGKFTIEDINHNSRLTLVPYSSNGRRGASYTVTLDESTDEPSEPNTGTTAGPTAKPTTESTANPATGSTTETTVPTHSPSEQAGITPIQSTTIPKAPNTGVRKLSKKGVHMSSP